MRFINLADLLGKTSGDPDPATREWGKAFADLLGVKDCGEDDCPIHGSNDGDTWITQEDRDDLDAGDLLQLAITAASDANNATINGQIDKAKLHQNQSLIWSQLHTLLLAEEKAQAESGAAIKDALRREREQQPDPFEDTLEPMRESVRKPQYPAPSEDGLMHSANAE
jgi:hypothetical protein